VVSYFHSSLGEAAASWGTTMKIATKTQSNTNGG